MKDKYSEPGFDVLSDEPNSVKTGRSLAEVAKQEDPSEMADFQ